MSADPREHRVHTIEGTMTRSDGVVVHWMIDHSGSWHQWGAPEATLGETVDVVEAMRDGLAEAGVELTDRDDEPTTADAAPAPDSGGVKWEHVRRQRPPSF